MSTTRIVSTTLRPAREGSVFLFALLVMTSVIVFGLSFAATSTMYLQIQDTDRARAYARAVADGGMEVAYQTLHDTPAFRGNLGPTSIGDGSYTISIQGVAGGAEIQVVSSVDAQSSTFLSQASIASVLDIKETFLVGGNIVSSNSDPKWGGDVVYTGSLMMLVGGNTEGRKTSGSFPSIGLDSDLFLATADLKYGSDPGLAGDQTGSIHCAGPITISGPCVIKGSIFVQGDLTIDGGGGSVALLADNSTGFAFAEGHLRIQNVSSLTVNGTLIATGNVTLQNVASFRSLGSIVTNGNLTFTDSDGTWEYDQAILSDPPRFVTGGPRRTEVDELWRRRD